MECTEPLVSVVIPTRNRPHLVGRAVRSALAQTLDAIEVIVVVDGPDEASLQALRQIDDARLKVKTLPLNLGPGGARNAGIGEARSPWIAFLDDDDEWLPQKLEIQMQTAQQSGHLYPVIACRVIARSEVGDSVWPRRLPKPDEHLSDYMFCQKGFFKGEGLILTPTIFTKKELLQKVPFRDLRRLEDVDWLLQVSTVEGIGVEFVPTPEPLAIVHVEENGSRTVTRTNRGSYRSLAWIQANRHLVTPRAYASFLLTWTATHVARRGDWRTFLLLLWEACRHGRPTVVSVLLYLAVGLIPWRARRRIAAFFESRLLKWR